MELSSIGKYIRQFRQAKKLRQEDLAERAGLSVNYVGALERGEKVPSLETFVCLANALEISSDLLLSDVLFTGYKVKDSLFAEKLNQLSPQERARIYDVVDTLVRHANSIN